MTTGRALFIDHGVYPSLGFIAEQAERRGFDVVAVRSPQGLDPRDFVLITVLGSDAAVYDAKPWVPDELAFVSTALDQEVPVFGICFGAQVLARCLGGEVAPATRPELGWKAVDSRAPDLVDPGPWFQMHGDAITLPPAAVELARNECGLQAFEQGRSLGVQFHPEVTEAHVDEWMSKAPEFVTAAGEHPADVRRQTSEVIGDARRRAYRLFDRVWERCGG